MPNAAAVVKLQNSKLYDQDQLLLSDTELKSLNLALKGSASVSIVESVTDATVTRTIEGASTVEITLFDRDREILKSGRLGAKVDINIDGLWFRLRSLRKQGDSLTLMFEDREVSILRTYNKHMVAARDTLSRTRFIKKMIDEVKEMKIPFVCPEMDKLPPRRPIVNSQNFYTPDGSQEWERNPGFGDGVGGFVGTISVNGTPADLTQMSNTDKVLQVGSSRGASWSVMVAAVIVINEESGARNLSYSSDGLSAGLFQQIYEPHKYAWGTKEEVMDIAWSANRFYDGAIAAYLKNPAMQPEYIALNAQVAGNQEARIIPIWKKFREEAERTVSRWGVTKDAKMAAQGKVTSQSAKSTIEQRAAEEAAKGSDLPAKDKAAVAAGTTGGTGATAGGSMISSSDALELESEDYQFHRGTFSIVDGQEVPKPENTWECAGRLAEEINWRRFVVSGTFYLMSEPYLFRSKPQLKLDESTPGVISIDGEYTVGTMNSTVTVSARVGRWSVPPGAMVEIFESGPLSGRWLVAEISRNLFDTTMEIKLKKPRPILKEPNLDQPSELRFTLPGTITPMSSAGYADTTSVPVAKAESLVELRDLVTKGKISFSHANDRSGVMLSGSVLRTDGSLVSIDPAIVSFLVWAGRQWKLNISSMLGSHDQYVKDSHPPRESRHWTGHAIDINEIGHSVSGIVQSPATTPAVKEFMRAVGMLSPSFIPNQLICNGCGQEDATVQELQLDNGNPKSGHWVDGHIDHVHVGF
jgi:hypothetical protein